MNTVITKILVALGLKTAEVQKPAELSEIVASFETQLNNLNERVQFDRDLIIQNEEEVKRLQDESEQKAKDIERANRIKANIESFIA